MVQSGQIAVGTTPTLIVSPAQGGTLTLAHRGTAVDIGIGRSDVALAGVNEIQDVDDGDATAGDFKLRVRAFGGLEIGVSAAIPFNESAANVQTALNTIDGVTVGLPTGVGSVADPYVITFSEPAAADLPLMEVVEDTTTGGSGAGVTANTDGKSAGWHMVQNDVLQMVVSAGSDIYGIVAASTEDVHYLLT
jgi:hypothetical protein